MKIALVLSAPPGYSETFFNSQIKGLKVQGHEVTLYTGKVSDIYDQCRHITHPSVNKNNLIQAFLMVSKGLTLLPYTRTVRRYFNLEKQQGTPIKRIVEKIYLNAALLKYKGDWIHYGFATVALERELVPQAVGSKMAVSFRGYDLNVYPLKQPHCYDLLWQQVDKVHSISKYLLDKAFALGLDKRKPFQIIHPAVDLEGLPKTKYEKASTQYKIVTIARFGWIKGLELLTEVALHLKNLGVEYDWTLIGTGTTAEKERFIYDVSAKQLQNHLHNIGKTSHEETLKIVNNSQVYVQTSLNEGFCNALLEAQALGIPCVAFKVGGIPENVVDGQTGCLIAPFNTYKMAEKIQELLLVSLDLRTKSAHAAMERVADDFNIKKQRKAFNEFYTNDR